MAVTVNGSVGAKDYSHNSAGTRDYVFTVASGSNLALILTVNFGGAADVSSISAVWDQGGTNQSMTQLVVINNSGNSTSVIFGLRNPTVVTNGTARVTWTTTADDTFIAAICFAGVEQSNDGAAFPHTASENTNLDTVSVTSATGNIVVACEDPASGASTLTGTTIYKDSSSGDWINAGANYDDGAATVVIGATGGCRTIVAVDVAAASGGSTFTATIGCTMGSSTLALAATFAPGTHTATLALANSAKTAAVSATFIAPVYTATIGCLNSVKTTSISATFVAPVYTATIGCVNSVKTAAINAQFAAAIYSASIGCVNSIKTLALSATFSPGTHTAVMSLTNSVKTAAIAATFSPGTHTATIGCVNSVKTAAIFARTNPVVVAWWNQQPMMGEYAFSGGF